MPHHFTGLVAQRWLESQPADIQDLLKNYAQVRCSGLGIVLLFECEEFAKAARCQAHRMVEPLGLPSLPVTFKFGDLILPVQGTTPRPPKYQA